MSDYMPTTDNVRWGYSSWVITNGREGLDSELEFDRWLAQHDAEVAKKERDIIIRRLVGVTDD